MEWHFLYEQCCLCKYWFQINEQAWSLIKYKMCTVQFTIRVCEGKYQLLITVSPSLNMEWNEHFNQSTFKLQGRHNNTLCVFFCLFSLFLFIICWFYTMWCLYTHAHGLSAFS